MSAHQFTGGLVSGPSGGFTAGYVPFGAATGGGLTESANLQFSSNALGIGTAPGAAAQLYVKAGVGAGAFILLEAQTNSVGIDAQMRLSVAGASGGDPFLHFLIPGASQFAMGMDNSDADRFKLSSGGVLGTSDIVSAGTSDFTVESGANLIAKSQVALDASATVGTVATLFGGNNRSGLGVEVHLCRFGPVTYEHNAAVATQRFHNFTQNTIAQNIARTVTDAVTIYIQGAPIAGTNCTITNNYALWIDADAARFDGRILAAKGADVASASTLTLGAGNHFQITGTTTCNHITTTGWTAGSKIVLKFSASLTFTHNAGSPPANTAPVLLSASANFSATANDTLTLIYDGTNWYECARTVI